MGIRVAYGNRTGVQDAIRQGIIPRDSIIIGTYGEDGAELTFYDAERNLKHLVAQTKFDSTDEAVRYAISQSEVGQIITVLDGSVYTACVVQPDFTLREIGLGKYRPETIEELVSDVDTLKGESHSHTNKNILDSITEERMLKWDSGIADTDDLPVATDTMAGFVRGSTKENGVSVATDGTMEVNSLSIDKLVQKADSTIIFRCGSAAE